MEIKNFTAIESSLFIDSPAAVNLRTGVLYVNPKCWNDLSDTEKKFVIAHELGHYNLNTSDEFKADDFAMWRCMELGQAQIDSLKALYKQLPFETEEQRQRTERQLKRIFEEASEQGNVQAGNFLQILNEESLDTDKVSESRGRVFLKISATIGGAVGAVLSAIPVTSAIGAGVVALSAAQKQAAANIEQKIANGQATAQEKELAYLVRDAEYNNYMVQASQTANKEKELKTALKNRELDAKSEQSHCDYINEKAATTYSIEMRKYPTRRNIGIALILLIIAAAFFIYKRI